MSGNFILTDRCPVKGASSEAGKKRIEPSKIRH